MLCNLKFKKLKINWKKCNYNVNMQIKIIKNINKTKKGHAL